MRDKTKSRTIKDDKWEIKAYTEQSKGDVVKGIIKIRLHTWDLKKNSTDVIPGANIIGGKASKASNM